MKRQLEGKNEISKEQIKVAMDLATSQVMKNLPEFTDKFQINNSENGFYTPSENTTWTSGFWTGEIWLSYEYTQDEAYKIAAEKQVESFKVRMDEKIEIDNHDMGFLYSLSCVSAYKLTGNETGKNAAIAAADYLITRFNSKGDFIQAWGPIGDPNNQRLIIDCLLNMPLLYWATETTGDTKYAEIATKHIKTTMKYITREDSSTYHTFFFDPETGEPLNGVTHQGYKNDSAWSRGQAWGVYGMALAYKYVKDPAYIELFERVADFFIDHLPTDLIPYWDFTFTDGSDEPRDSSAAVIAICGMLEMSKHLPAEKAEYYVSTAKKMLAAVAEICAIGDYRKSNGVINMATYARSSEFNPCNNRGLNECNTWGDYFYMEALTRLLTDWKLYW